MFNFFKKKAVKPNDSIFRDLGSISGKIVDIANLETDAEIALQGLAILSSIRAINEKRFGWDVKPNTIFAYFFSTAADKNISKMAEIIREMSEALLKVDEQHLKGALIYFWFNGNKS